MAKKMNRGLVAFSSAAILCVYGAGYALSQPAALNMAASLADANTPASAPSATSPTNSTAASAGSITSVPSPSTSGSAQTAIASLRDGTYTGSGTSRHGGVNVNVTIKSGRITSAAITSVSTRYSQDVIAGLPAEVVSAQGASINLVSGATDSSTAYVQAVQQALSKAGSSTSATGGSIQVNGPKGVVYSSNN